MATSTVETDVWSRASAALRTLSAMPLIQSGMSLVVSSIITSGLGFVFWIVAARQYTSAELGIGSAVIAAMILLADVSQLGLKTGLVRFLPNAGADTRRLIVNSYGLAVAIAVVGSLVFLAGLNVWTPDLIGLRESFPWVLLFVSATAFWVVFLLEDSVLLGLRMTRWVPIENGIFGVLKILLLFPLAAVGGDFGVFLAWALPVFVIVAAVNLLVRRSLHRSAHAPTSTPAGPGPGADEASPDDAGGTGIVMREVLSYSVVDWTASAARTAVIGVLPLMVLAELGSSQSGYYFLAWTITYSVYILSANIGDALVAEASYDEANVDRHTLHSGLLSMAISAPVVLVATIAAPWVLQAFGTEYAVEATTVLRLLLLGAIPNVITRTFIGRLRAERRMGAVFVYEFALSASVLVLSWLLLGPFGIVGLGIAWLVTLTVAALYVLVVESIWWWAPRLDSRVVGVAVGLAEPVRALLLRLPSRDLDPDVRRSLQHRYRTRPRWRRVARTPDTQTVVVTGHEGRPPLRIELARTAWGNEMLGRRVVAVARIGDLPAPAPTVAPVAIAGAEHAADGPVSAAASLRALVPFPIDHDDSADRHAVVESAISGAPGSTIAGPSTGQLVDAVLGPLAELHHATADCMTFDGEALSRWVSLPLRSLGDAAQVAEGDLLTLGRLLRDGLGGLMVPSALIHGNLTLDNLLFDPGGKLMGVINWEWSVVGPAFLDRATLALSALSVDSGEDLGQLVSQLLDHPEPLVEHQAFTGAPSPVADGRALVLLAWLHVLAPTLRRSGAGNAAPFWTGRNVSRVMAHASVRMAVDP